MRQAHFWNTLLLVSICTVALTQSLPETTRGTWYDPENPLSSVELLPAVNMVLLPEGIHTIQQAKVEGNAYQLTTRNEQGREVVMQLQLPNETEIQFAIAPSPLRTFVRDPVATAVNRPFRLNLQEGETYFLELRMEENRQLETPDNPYEPRQNIERARYRYTVEDRPTDSTYLLDMRVERVVYISRYYNGFTTYTDTHYTLPEERTYREHSAHWLTEQRFQLEIDRQARVLRYQKMREGAAPVSPLSRAAPEMTGLDYSPDGFGASVDRLPPAAGLWTALPPKPYYRKMYQGTISADLVDEARFYLAFLDLPGPEPKQAPATRSGRLLRYAFPNETILAIDTTSGWLRYGRLRSVNEERTIDITLSGWTQGGQTAVVTGQLLNAPVGSDDLEQNIRRYLASWKNLSADVTIDETGHFRLECAPDQPLYLPESPLVPLYLRRGDRIEMNIDLSRGVYTADFSGDAAPELAYVLRQFRRLRERHNIRPQLRQSSPADYHELVMDRYRKSRAELDSLQTQLDPLLFRRAHWDLRYLAANQLLTGWAHHQRQSPSGAVPLEVEVQQLLQRLPINNDEAVGLQEYQQFLSSHYLDYRRTKLRNFFRGTTSQPTLGEVYALSKYMYTGAPLFDQLALLLKSSIRYDMMPPAEIDPFLRDFLQLSPDESTNQQLRDQFAALKRLEPGHVLPRIRARNAAGQWTDSKDWPGRNTLFIPFGSNDIYLQDLNLDNLQARYPELRIVLLTFYDQERWAALSEEYRHVDERFLYFIPDEAARRQLHDQLHLYNFSFPRSSFGRAYLVDRRAQIFEYFRPQQSLHLDLIELRQRLDQLAVYRPGSRLWQRVLGWVILGLSLGGAAVWFFAHWRQRREQRRRELIEMEIRSLRAQLNPHFIFNTMGSIQNLIASERPELANDYLADLAALMRKVLRYTQRGVISLEEELDLIRQYAALENLRKPFELEIERDPAIHPAEIEWPALLLQPLVENAILHGIAPLEKGGKIRIEVGAAPKQTLIRITDNGIGLKAAAEKASNGNQLGLNMSADRLRLLYGNKASIALWDRNGEQSGTVIEIKLPST